MKILHVIDNLGGGGAERLLYDLCRVAPSSETIEILLLSQKNNVYLNEIINLGIRVTISPYAMKSLKNIGFIRDFVKKNQFDIVHAHLFPAFYFVAYACKKLSVKLVVSEHVTENSRSKWYFRKIENGVYKNYAKVICVSSAVKEAIIKRHLFLKDRAEVIANGIDIDRFKVSQTKENYFVMVARLCQQKNHITLLKAMQSFPEYKLLLIGTGPLEEMLKSEVETLGLKNQVEFIGYIPDITEYLSKAKLSILTSDWEGFGIIAVESMASGTPFVCSDIHVLKEVVGDAGVLFKKGDAEELSEKISHLLSNEAEYRVLIDKGFERVKEFDIRKTAMNYEAVYRNLLSNKGR